MYLLYLLVTSVSFGTWTASSGSDPAQLILASELTIKLTEVLLGLMILGLGTARSLPANFQNFKEMVLK